MTKLQYYDLLQYINRNNKIGEGKEVDVYKYQDKVIKLFHAERKTPIPRMSDEGLIALTQLSFHCFQNPIDIIYREGKIVGYTELFLEEKEINFELIDFDGIKQDLITLSENGFCIEDLFYNYIFTDTKLLFNDLTSYHYLKTDVPFLKGQNLRKNTIVMNNFLIGFLQFGAFRKGMTNEYTKMYLANDYREKHCGNLFYGDFIKLEKNESSFKK